MKRNGFTLIEILLVVVIIGIMLAVIVPRAWRANIDTKYGIVRQNCTELAAYGNQWVEQGIQTQNPDTSTATAVYYLAALCGADNVVPVPPQTRTEWVAENTGRRSWGPATTNGQRNRIMGRVEATGGATGNAPEEQVMDLIPPEKQILNPFNGVSVFGAPNKPGGADQPITGALACGGAWEGDFAYVALIFQGTDSTTTNVGLETSFHAGMSNSLEGLRNGIFVARAR